MNLSRSRLALAGRRGTMLGAAFALLAGVVAAPAAQAQETTPGTVSDASFVWGVSGYAQQGATSAFGPWRFFDNEGDASILLGTVSGGTQEEYTPAAYPVTSMPAKSVGGKQATPNAVKFSNGEGARDSAGTVTIEWDGQFTFNGYPASFNAPDEILSDPKLTVEADGSGSLEMDVSIGAGVDIEGNPAPAVNAGRHSVLTFAPGGAAVSSDGTVTLSPEFADVEYANEGDDEQVRDCVAPNQWGSWNADFVKAVSPSVRPHYYSTDCGQTNNIKAPLPVQLNYAVAGDEVEQPIGTPQIAISQSSFSAEGEHQVTVTGTGFNDPSVVGTRPPLAGQPSGAYVVFGKFLDTWKPSADAPSTARKVVEQRWALPAASFNTMGGQPPYAEIAADGSFSITLTVSKAKADVLAAEGNYGVYTYAAGGASKASYEQFAPISFTPADIGGGENDGGDNDNDDDDTGTIGGGSLAGLTNLFGSLI